MLITWSQLRQAALVGFVLSVLFFIGLKAISVTAHESNVPTLRTMLLASALVGALAFFGKLLKDWARNRGMSDINLIGSDLVAFFSTIGVFVLATLLVGGSVLTLFFWSAVIGYSIAQIYLAVRTATSPHSRRRLTH